MVMSMHNILNIIKGDFRRLTSSVVAIVILMGLCVLPCLYAWFNIFSNWDPYAPTATGRIAVAVANEDEGTDLMGLYVNVGEKITEELKANNMIGWTFVSKEKAMKGLRAGDYYAAVVIPEDFSADVLSFTTGDLTHPELDYYENVKKNAIAPKITEKAQRALKEEVDVAFIDAIATYVGEAADVANATGLDPEDVFSDLGNRLGLLGDRMDDLVAVITAAEGLSDAANQLLKASGNMAGGTQDALKTGEKVLDEEEAALPELEKDAKSVAASIKKEANAIADGLDIIYKDLSKAATDMDAFNDFVLNDLKARKTLVHDMAQSAEHTADRLETLGLTGMAARFRDLAQKLNDIYAALDELEQADESTWPVIQKQVKALLQDIKNASDKARSIADDANTDMDDKITQTINETRKAIRELRSSLESSYSNLDTLISGLTGAEKTLQSLNGDLDISVADLIDMQTNFRSLAELFDSMADSEVLDNVNYLISDGTDEVAQNLARPVQMRTKTIYPVRNFGSVMASFYTVLAQWIGALFAAVLIRTRVKRKEDEGGETEEGVAAEEGLLSAADGGDGTDSAEGGDDTGGPRLRDQQNIREPRLFEQFFGRYRLFLMIGLIQGLIISLGDLLYVGIQCEHPVLFVIAACVNALVFTMVNYAIVFAFDRVGLALTVIVVLIQVAGSGGTFPPEVLPGVFRVLYPFMPFHYAMDAMRECIAGMYGHTYVTCLAILLLMGAIAAALGMLLARPMDVINRMIRESMRKSDIMEG